MTRYESRLKSCLTDLLGDLSLDAALDRLFDEGLLDITACERRMIRGEIERLGREGMPRCEAFEAAAQSCCCSYEKARNAFYHPYKTRK